MAGKLHVTTAKALAEEEKRPLLADVHVSLRRADSFSAPSGLGDRYPSQDATCISSALFSWVTPLMELGNQRPLEHDDLYLLDPANRAHDVSTEFQEAWRKQCSKPSGKPSLAWALASCFGGQIAKAGLLKLVHDSLQFVAPMLIKEIIAYLQNPEAPLSEGLVYAAIVFVSGVMQSFLLRNYFFHCFESGMRVRSAICTAVYSKSLVLSAAARQKKTTGEITNLMSIDAQRLQELSTFINSVWFSIFQIVVACYLLWKQIGPATFAGVAVIILMLPLTAGISKLMRRLQLKLMKVKDERIKICNEVLAGMKVIKLQAWEHSFTKRVLEFRSEELSKLRTYIYARSGSMTLFSAIPSLVTVSSFYTYVKLGNTLDVGTALTSLALFNILRFPLFMLPQVLNSIVEASVSVDRLSSYFQEEEREKVTPGDLDSVGVRVRNADFMWETSPSSSSSESSRSQEEDSLLQEDSILDKEALGGGDNLPVLQGVTLEAHPGDLIAVIGHIIVLEHGTIVEDGAYEDLMEKDGGLLMDLVAKYKDQDQQEPHTIEEVEDDISVDELEEDEEDNPTPERFGRRLSRSSVRSERTSEGGGAEAQLITDEDRSVGDVAWQVYKTWILAFGGISAGLLVIVVFIGTQCVNLLSTWWLSFWSEHSKTKDDDEQPADPQSQMFYVYVYMILNVVYAIALYVRAITTYKGGLRASKSLFQDLLARILRAPTSFFDTTPTGRIVNRLSKDVYTVDESIPATWSMLLNTFISVLVTLATISYVTPIFMIILLPVLVGYFISQRYFIKSSRELQRLDSISRSPVFALLSETLDGLPTIRAYRAETQFSTKNEELLDRNQRAYFLNFAVNCWLALRLEFAGTLIAAFAALTAVLAHSSDPERGAAFAGLAGVSLTYAFSVTQSLNWSVRMLSQLQTQMISVERIKNYTVMDMEAELTSVGKLPPAQEWPSAGAIEFRDVNLRYRPEDGGDGDVGNDVCSDVAEAIYLLARHDAVVYDRAALAWKCFIPAKSSIQTRFGKVLCLVVRSHDGTLVCSHPSGTAYLSGCNVIETREGGFVDKGMVSPNAPEENEAGGRISEPKTMPKTPVSTRARDLDLRGCHFDRESLTQLSRGLATNRFVTTLSLSGNHLQDGDMALLSSALVHNGCLLELALSYNEIGETGSTFLAKALATNYHIRVLDLMHNRIGKDGITPWLGDTMRVNYALRELKLSHNAIGDKKTVDLLQALSPKPVTEEEQLKARIAGRRRHTTMSDSSVVHDASEPFNSTLRMLLLSNTGISDEASTHLAHMLSHARSLTHLDISCNDFSSEGNLAIARGLQHNASLRYLNYRENKLNETAALALLRALKVHSFVETALFQDCFGSESSVGSALGQLTKTTRSLVTLDLSHCPLEPPGVVELYYALAENTSLRSVDLTCSNLKSDSAAGILAKSLQQNTTLTFLNLSYNEITLRGCKLLRDGVAARSETAARLLLSLEGNSGEKCHTGTIITGGMRPVRPPLIN
ncbi:hypothetical protein KRP22_013215 [Phytophthora ramorum]|nr:Multidrug resistance-associated protein 1 [Phytophthora ramorum]